MWELTIKQIIYKNPFDRNIQDDLQFDEDYNLINHKCYLDYSSKHTDNIIFNSYKEAEDFFIECYGELLNDFENNKHAIP